MMKRDWTGVAWLALAIKSNRDVALHASHTSLKAAVSSSLEFYRLLFLLSI